MTGMDVYEAARLAFSQKARRVLLVALAGVVLLAVLLVIHSMAGLHGAGPTTSGAVARGAEVSSSSAMPGSAAETGVPSCAGVACELECGAMAAACALVILSVGILLIAAFPAVYHRLLDRGRAVGFVVVSIQGALLRPSLIVLSISRT